MKNGNKKTGGDAGFFMRASKRRDSFRNSYAETPYLRKLLPANRLLKRSTRPPESTIFCLPVKKGWHRLHTSTVIS